MNADTRDTTTCGQLTRQGQDDGRDGGQPYSDQDSSRDSMITAMVTLGEGYHNYHHTFPYDYRNGVRAYHWDPTKWFIRGLGFTRLTGNLVRTPPELILRARIQMQERRAGDVEHDRLAALRKRLDELMEGWVALLDRLREWKAQKGGDSRRMLRQLRREVREARRRVYEAYRGWVNGLQEAKLAHAAS